MRIAVTSQNFKTVTGHAGKTRRFLIFEAVKGADPVEVERLDLPKNMSMHETPEDAAHPLDHVDMVITQSCGEGFPRKLARRGIRVAVSEIDDPVEAVKAVLSVLQQ
jgi:predicted Fe-Mo cluster-binding NifX family protein